MLSELVLVATSVTPAEGGGTSTEACISFYDVHTHSTSSSPLKKTTSSTNCVAASSGHVFAAQSDKAVLNVYNRSKGNIEASLPLGELGTSIACSVGGGLVAIGTEKGRLNVWETASGRYTSTDTLHLQKVTVVVFDRTGNLIITGSADSNVHVWSVPLLLDPKGDRRPLRTMEKHRAEITGICCARGTGPASVVLTGSRDMSCLVWNPYDGTVLKTFVFQIPPTCVALDPADRGFYAGFEDGTVKQVEFAKGTTQTEAPSSRGQHVNGHTNNGAVSEYANPLFAADNIPASVSESRWSAEGHDSAVLSIDTVFEGNLVVTGDAKGNVSVWDVATGHLFRVLARHKAPVTNIKILPPTGFPKMPADKPPTTLQTIVVPPRYRNIVNASSDSTPPITIGFNGTIPPSDFSQFDTKQQQNNVFSPAADLQAISRGLKFFSTAPAPPTADIKTDEDSDKVQRLEKELAEMQTKYDRLSDIHKRTWEEHSKWMMAVDGDKAEAEEEQK